jgi:hypothetical protein
MSGIQSDVVNNKPAIVIVTVVVTVVVTLLLMKLPSAYREYKISCLIDQRMKRISEVDNRIKEIESMKFNPNKSDADRVIDKMLSYSDKEYLALINERIRLRQGK